MTSLSNINVLFLPKNSRTPYFKALLQTARDRSGWQISVAAPSHEEKMWKGVVGERGAVIAVPDFLQVQPWESDVARIRTIDEFVTACEESCGTSTSRIILAGERDLGRGFSLPVFHWFHNATARAVLADNVEPARIVRRQFDYACSLLDKARPDVVIAGEWADPLWYTVWMVAQQRGIPCVANRFSKLWSGRVYWTCGQLMYNDHAQEIAQSGIAAGDAPSDRAVSRLEDFRKGPQTLGYVKEGWQKLADRGFFATHVEIARIFLNSVRQGRNDAGSGPRKPTLRLLGDYYGSLWRNWRQSGFFQKLSDDELVSSKYIFIALHKDPEQALNYQAPIWSNQFNTVALLSSSLPDGFRLLVREHRKNAGRRPTQFYKDIRRLPGVTLIDAFDDQFRYIKNANLVVTENGSVGWEGILLGRPVLTLAANFYDGADIALKVPEAEQLSVVICRALMGTETNDNSQRRRAAGLLLDAEWETSAPLEDDGFMHTLDLLSLLLSRSQTAPDTPQTASA